MPNIKLANDQILVEVITVEDKIGVLWSPGSYEEPKGKPGALETKVPKHSIWLKIIDIGKNVDSETFKIGYRVILQSGYEHMTGINMSLYSAGKDMRKLAVVEPRYIALVLDYTAEEEEIRKKNTEDLKSAVALESSERDRINSHVPPKDPNAKDSIMPAIIFKSNTTKSDGSRVI